MKLIPLLVLVVTEWPEGAEHVWQDSEIRFNNIPFNPDDFFPCDRGFDVGVADEVQAAAAAGRRDTFCPNIEGAAGTALMVTQTEWQEARDATAQ
jgi:hypothetical protein